MDSDQVVSHPSHHFQNSFGGSSTGSVGGVVD